MNEVMEQTVLDQPISIQTFKAQTSVLLKNNIRCKIQQSSEQTIML